MFLKVVIILTALLASFSGLLIFCSTLIFSFNDKSQRVTEIVVNKYQYLEVNIQNNVTTKGIVSLPDLLGKDDFLFNNDGILHTLVSNFGSEEYKCTGSCYCGENQRRSTTVLSRSVVYLLTAFSSTVAFKLALDHYSQECIRKFEGDCSKESIFTEVDECKSLGEIEEEIISLKSRLKELEHLKFLKSKNLGKHKVYRCEGNCYPRHFRSPSNFGCENLVYLGVITVKNGETNFGFHNPLRVAISKFQRGSLKSFCEVESHIETWIDPTSDSRRVKKWNLKKNICQEKPFESTKNPSIVCRNIDMNKLSSY